MKRIFILFFIFSVLLLITIIVSINGRTEEAKVIILNAPFRGDVLFPHDDHAFKGNIACMECHHTYRQTGFIISCKECHNNQSTAGSRLKVYHRLCISCHITGGNAQKAPHKCDDCHQGSENGYILK